MRHGRKDMHTIYDRMDAAATINFGTQFGVATIREQCLFRLAQVRAEKNSVKK